MMEEGDSRNPAESIVAQWKRRQNGLPGVSTTTTTTTTDFGDSVRVSAANAQAPPLGNKAENHWPHPPSILYNGGSNGRRQSTNLPGISEHPVLDPIPPSEVEHEEVSAAPARLGGHHDGGDGAGGAAGSEPRNISPTTTTGYGNFIVINSGDDLANLLRRSEIARRQRLDGASDGNAADMTINDQSHNDYSENGTSHRGGGGGGGGGGSSQPSAGDRGLPRFQNDFADMRLPSAVPSPTAGHRTLLDSTSPPMRQSPPSTVVPGVQIRQGTLALPVLSTVEEKDYRGNGSDRGGGRGGWAPFKGLVRKKANGKGGEGKMDGAHRPPLGDPADGRRVEAVAEASDIPSEQPTLPMLRPAPVQTLAYPRHSAVVGASGGMSPTGAVGDGASAPSPHHHSYDSTTVAATAVADERGGGFMGTSHAPLPLSHPRMAPEVFQRRDAGLRRSTNGSSTVAGSQPQVVVSSMFSHRPSTLLSPCDQPPTQVGGNDSGNGGGNGPDAVLQTSKILDTTNMSSSDAAAGVKSESDTVFIIGRPGNWRSTGDAADGRYPIMPSSGSTTTTTTATNGAAGARPLTGVAWALVAGRRRTSQSATATTTRGNSRTRSSTVRFIPSSDELHPSEDSTNILVNAEDDIEFPEDEEEEGLADTGASRRPLLVAEEESGGESSGSTQQRQTRKKGGKTAPPTRAGALGRAGILTSLANLSKSEKTREPTGSASAATPITTTASVTGSRTDAVVAVVRECTAPVKASLTAIESSATTTERSESRSKSRASMPRRRSKSADPRHVGTIAGVTRDPNITQENLSPTEARRWASKLNMPPPQRIDAATPTGSSTSDGRGVSSGEGGRGCSRA